MSKLFIFGFLWWLLGNPFLAIIVLIVVLYLLDRRFIGISPSLLKPLRRRSRVRALKQELRMQPHSVSAKLELARLMMEQNKHSQSLPLLEQTRHVMEDSPDVLADIGLCHLKLGSLEEGERCVLEALSRNERVKFGEPYLRMGEAFAEQDAAKAIDYLQRFKGIHSSSCEAYYRLGQLYRKLGRNEEAKQAYEEAIDIYRSLPKYKRKSERKYAILSWFRR